MQIIIICPDIGLARGECPTNLPRGIPGVLFKSWKHESAHFARKLCHNISNKGGAVKKLFTDYVSIMFWQEFEL